MLISQVSINNFIMIFVPENILTFNLGGNTGYHPHFTPKNFQFWFQNTWLESETMGLGEYSSFV